MGPELPPPPPPHTATVASETPRGGDGGAEASPRPLKCWEVCGADGGDDDSTEAGASPGAAAASSARNSTGRGSADEAEATPSALRLVRPCV